MITVSDNFKNQARGSMRKLSYQLRMSFDKVFNDSTTFFTIGSSLIGGSDFLPGVGNVVQEWDKYTYADFSDRVISIAWERHTEPIASVSLAMADIVLDNHDNYFSPDGTSPIADYIKPYRPIRLYAGFDGEVIPVFIGLTESMPLIDEKEKTATFHCIDFLESILNRPLVNSLMYENYTIDQILSELFQVAGLSESQLNFEPTTRVVPVTFFSPDTKLKSAVTELVMADLGRLYMDENGVIQYKPMQSYDTDVVYSFGVHEIRDFITKKQNDIINVVEVNGKVREVQPKQSYQSFLFDITLSDASTREQIRVPAGGTKDIWIQFLDPVTSVDTPVNSATATTSSFTSRTLAGTLNTNVTLSSSYILSGTTYKMTFSNSDSVDLYVTQLELFATPAPVVRNINIRRQDNASVESYDERIYTIDNNFLQNESDAITLANIILITFSEFGGINQISVKGTMALQIDDVISVNLFGRVGTYIVERIQNAITQPAQFKQLITVKKFNLVNYFTIATSLIGGDDKIKP